MIRVRCREWRFDCCGLAAIPRAEWLGGFGFDACAVAYWPKPECRVADRAATGALVAGVDGVANLCDRGGARPASDYLSGSRKRKNTVEARSAASSERVHAGHQHSGVAIAGDGWHQRVRVLRRFRDDLLFGRR